jgi:hypothetical protein
MSLRQLQRERDGSVLGHEHADSRMWLLRRVANRMTVIALTSTDGAASQLARAFWAEADAAVAAGDLTGRYRLSPTDHFDIVQSGTAIEVRAIGTEATARLLFGLPQHPEWPQMLKEFEAHALLHLKPMLKRDAPSLERSFDASAPAGAASRTLALVEGLVDRHGPPGKAVILGTRTLGAVTTSVQILFGSTPVTLRMFWHGHKLSEVKLDEADYPTHVTFSRRGELYEAKSLDGKQALAIAVKRTKAGVAAIVFTDGSKRGKTGIACAREP